MNLSSTDLIRARIDALRSTAKRGDQIHEEMKSNLAGFLETHGLFDATSHLAQANKSEDRHHSGVIHLCPWHTCQATRHGISQSN